MTIKPNELTGSGYELLNKLEHKELVPFIRTYIKKRTRFSVIYYLANLLALALVVIYFVCGHRLPGYDVGDRFNQFAYGLALAFALVPLHEYIHVLAYRSQGAKHTSIDANLKKLYFMAIADQFVANRKEFQTVALAPFLIINGGMLMLLFFTNTAWSLPITGALLAHTAMCSGDFGLLSYFDFHKHLEVVTYDDVQNKVSYFYGRTAEKHSDA